MGKENVVILDSLNNIGFIYFFNNFTHSRGIYIIYTIKYIVRFWLRLTIHKCILASKNKNVYVNWGKQKLKAN